MDTQTTGKMGRKHNDNGGSPLSKKRQSDIYPRAPSEWRSADGHDRHKLTRTVTKVGRQTGVEKIRKRDQEAKSVSKLSQ